MNLPYVVDLSPLTSEEGQRHRSACNAAISDGRTVQAAFDVADDAIREYRRRLGQGYARAATTKYVLVSREEVVARWLEVKTIYTAAENAIVAKMRDLARPALLSEIPRLAGVSEEAVRSLVSAGVLVPEEAAS